MLFDYRNANGNAKYLLFINFVFFLRYPAKICRVDSEEEKALIHFEGWNHRFDEWISFNSEKIRASTRSVDSKDEKTVRQPEVRSYCYNCHL